MIYALTDSEMKAFCKASCMEMTALCPVAELCADTDNLNNTEEKTAGLIKMSLVRRNGDSFSLTPEGKILALALFRPQAATEITRKNAEGASFSALRYGDLWHVHTHDKPHKLHLIWSAFSRPMLVRWIKDTVGACDAAESEGAERTDISLTYDEWLTFLVSQLIHVRHTVKKGAVPFTFTVDSLPDPAVRKYYDTTLSALGEKRYAGMIRYLLLPENRDALRLALRGLCLKGVLDVTEDETFSYTDMTQKNLDNTLLIDTVRVLVKREEGFGCDLLISLRKNGAVMMTDDGQAVHLVSAPTVPWELYLE